MEVSPTLEVETPSFIRGKSICEMASVESLWDEELPWIRDSFAIGLPKSCSFVFSVIGEELMKVEDLKLLI